MLPSLDVSGLDVFKRIEDGTNLVSKSFSNSGNEPRSLKEVFQIQLMALSIGLSIWLIWFLRSFVLDLILAVIVAIVLDPAVKALARFGIKRSVSSGIVFIAALIVVAVTIFLVTKPLYSAGVKFSHELPSLVAQAQNGTGRLGVIIKHLHIDSYVRANSAKITDLLTSATGPALGAAKTVLSGIVGIVTIFLLALFIEIEAPLLFNAISEVVGPAKRALVFRVRERLTKAITGYVLGNLATSLIAGIVVFVTLEVLGVPFAVVLAVWVAVVDLLPLVGGLLAGVPTVAFALLHSVSAGVIAAIVFIVYQQLENHILNPVIMARTVRLNPLWILISVLIGANLLGFIGALIGIPAAAAIQVLGAEIWAVQQRKRGEVLTGDQLYLDDSDEGL